MNERGLHLKGCWLVLNPWSEHAKCVVVWRRGRGFLHYHLSFGMYASLVTDHEPDGTRK